MKIFIQLLTIMIAFTIAFSMPAVAASKKVQTTVSKEEVKINVNESDAKTILKKIKGIGKAKATAIVNYREQFGTFKSIDELINVRGISKQLLEQIRERAII